MVHEGNQAGFEEMSDDKLVETLKALGHPVRLNIMRALSATERNVGEIDEVAQIGQPTLSQQLAVLRNARLVKTRKEAKLVYYSIDRKRLVEMSAVIGDFGGSDAARAKVARPSPPGVANFAKLS